MVVLVLMTQAGRLLIALSHDQMNIGARRLHTVMEFLLRIYPLMQQIVQVKVTVDGAYVQDKLANIRDTSKDDLNRYIL